MRPSDYSAYSFVLSHTLSVRILHIPSDLICCMMSRFRTAELDWRRCKNRKRKWKKSNGRQLWQMWDAKSERRKEKLDSVCQWSWLWCGLWNWSVCSLSPTETNQVPQLHCNFRDAAHDYLYYKFIWKLFSWFTENWLVCMSKCLINVCYNFTRSKVI